MAVHDCPQPNILLGAQGQRVLLHATACLEAVSAWESHGNLYRQELWELGELWRGNRFRIGDDFLAIERGDSGCNCVRSIKGETASHDPCCRHMVQCLSRNPDCLHVKAIECCSWGCKHKLRSLHVFEPVLL